MWGRVVQRSGNGVRAYTPSFRRFTAMDTASHLTDFFAGDCAEAKDPWFQAVAGPSPKAQEARARVNKLWQRNARITSTVTFRIRLEK